LILNRTTVSEREEQVLSLMENFIQGAKNVVRLTEYSTFSVSMVHRHQFLPMLILI